MQFRNIRGPDEAVRDLVRYPMAPIRLRAQRMLNAAIGRGDIDDVYASTKRGANPNFAFSGTLPPLWAALRLKNMPLARALLACGARIDHAHHVVPGDEPINALEYAFSECTLAEVKFCFEAGGLPINARHQGVPLLAHCITQDNRELFEYLRDRGADLMFSYMDLTPLDYCFMYMARHEWYACRLAAAGCDLADDVVHNESLITPGHLTWLAKHMPRKLDFAYLGWVCTHLHVAHARALEDAGVKLHVWHLSMCIADSDCMCIAETLIDMFSAREMNTVFDRDGYLPIHRAIMADDVDLVERIIDAGGLLLDDKVGFTCEELAAWHAGDDVQELVAELYDAHLPKKRRWEAKFKHGF